MKRKLYNELLDWKDNENRKPLMFYGARQIGKTYIIREFCRNEFKNFYELNLFQDVGVINIYNESCNAEVKYKSLLSYAGVSEVGEDTVLFIDEIQESGELISNLKFICEEHPELRVICAGSLLGVSFKKTRKSFLVGKVDIIDMYPLDFEEFLMAFNESFLINEIKKGYENNKAIMESLHNKALYYYNLYLYSGGMPEVVQSLVDNQGVVSPNEDKTLDAILRSYFEDMNKYIDNKQDAVKIQSIYSTIPNQLGNTSHKFQYSLINDNARKANYEVALDWLLSSHIVLKTINNKLPSVPLIAHAEQDTFKLFLSDVGLLRKLSNITYKNIVLGEINEFKGILAENYVANELSAMGIKPLYYYRNERSTVEIDFLLQTNDGIIPLEVKKSENTQSKSLKTYIENFKPKYAIRISLKNFGLVNGIESIPLYAVFCLKDLL